MDVSTKAFPRREAAVITYHRSPPMQPLSVFIITYNNAHEIERCLQSVAEWAAEIVCVDSLSTDGTQDICRRYGAIVIPQPFLGYDKQLQFAETQCTHDWALNLYADETVSPELAREIQHLLAMEPDANGYKMPRRNYLHKRWIATAGYYPSLHLRLFRRSAGGHIERRLHQKIKVSGKVGRLRGAIDHWCWAQDGEIIDNLFEYARLEAEEMTANGQQVRWYHFTKPGREFLRRFLFRGGWRQGAFGAVVSMRKAVEHALRLILAWEMQNRNFLETPDAVYQSGQSVTENKMANKTTETPGQGVSAA
jgi:glycosyltransferase involved in cell wall biosynthesis